MNISIFCSSHVWMRPLHESGLRQHVYALYLEVFRDYNPHIYPRTLIPGKIMSGLKHAPAVFAADIAVLCPGYPIVAGALASWFKRDHSLIIHTWKVPGYTEDRTSARLHDMLLRQVFRHARAIVVASLRQKDQLERQGVQCPVLFAPVSVDSSFWHPEPPDLDDCLSRFGIIRDEYVLTVGGSDRDEAYAARIAKLLNLRYVRATYSPQWAKHARATLVAEHLEADALILVNPSHTELRSLYAGSAMLCLPTKTDTNPAGLSSLVEGLACGALVGIPNSIAAGYVKDGINGLILDPDPAKFVARLLAMRSSWKGIRETARTFSVTELRNSVIARNLRDNLFAPQ